MKGKKNELVRMLRGANWYKRHFKESVNEVFEILDGEILLGYD